MHLRASGKRSQFVVGLCSIVLVLACGGSAAEGDAAAGSAGKPEGKEVTLQRDEAGNNQIFKFRPNCLAFTPFQNSRQWGALKEVCGKIPEQRQPVP